MNNQKGTYRIISFFSKYFSYAIILSMVIYLAKWLFFK